MGYQKAAVNTEAIASVLNAGQGTILAVGLTGVLAVAAATAGVGTFTAGDLVKISCFIFFICFCHTNAKERVSMTHRQCYHTVFCH